MEQSQSLGHLYQPHLFMKNQPILIDFVLFLKIDEMDLVHLGVRHTRALFAKKDNWSGTWLAP